MANGDDKELREDVFRDPPAKFRGAPFWAWNTDLDEKELLWQIDRLKEMGFGGFFMHTRAGMSTEYLGKEFMDLVRACNRKAQEDGMFSYLYDEDRWPSGAAGGYVTQNKAYRMKSLVLSRTAPREMAKMHADDERDPKLLAAYDVILDADGKLQAYKRTDGQEIAQGEAWYAYGMTDGVSGWFNGFAYLDTMDAQAVDTFIGVTHEAYKKALGKEFGKSAPAVFTDEPRYHNVVTKVTARDGKDVEYPWTHNFAAEFSKRFGYDVIDRLPEIVWERADGKPASVRYHFFLLAADLFASTFCDRIGAWCEKNGIAFTGHVVEEPKLFGQTEFVGDAMRHYRKFTVPGIDMLCNRTEFSTAKQAQSVVHQYGKEGMMSELYGVTGWDFDFRGHKFQGDWQAALGVTLRVPHLAWVSMRGSAKRDYPASIHYQSSWYKEYKYIEDHFARIHTALTRGKPSVNVAVLHPIESAWMLEGVQEHTADRRATMEDRFENIIEWLLRGQTDFDFVNESLLPELYDAKGEGFAVGQMHYKAVLIPPIQTIRSTTLRALSEFAEKGGKILVCDDCPSCVDGKESDAAKALWRKARAVPFSRAGVVGALEEEREIEIVGGDGCRRNDLIYSLRVDGANKWLFIAHCDQASRINGADCRREDIRITVKGTYTATLYDTLNGTTRAAQCDRINGKTVIHTPCYACDSFLYLLTPSAAQVSAPAVLAEKAKVTQTIALPDLADYTASEPNVLVLDMPEWSRDGLHYNSREEILRIDGKVRRELGYTPANGRDVQPWRLPSQAPSEFVWLKFTVESELAVPCKLCYEYADRVIWNGEEIPPQKTGYFTDKQIYTMPLPGVRKGANELIVRAPISERVSLENMFLIGDFGVNVLGANARIVSPAKRLAFDSLKNQGMPFYGANITYKIPFACEDGDITVTSDRYIGALLGVRLDGKEAGKIVLPPYSLTVENVRKGEHTLELTLFGTRINTFGALHLAVPVHWKGTNMWYTSDSSWSYEYCLSDMGVLKKPTVVLTKKRS